MGSCAVRVFTRFTGILRLIAEDVKSGSGLGCRSAGISRENGLDDENQLVFVSLCLRVFVCFSTRPAKEAHESTKTQRHAHTRTRGARQCALRGLNDLASMLYVDSFEFSVLTLSPSM